MAIKRPYWREISQYCAYQERCHLEVRHKLSSLGANKEECEQLLAELVEENFLNEERFACNYARGHFYLKKWGKLKIVQHLKQKQISPYCIKRAMLEIADEDYFRCLVKLIEKKVEELGIKERNAAVTAKLYRYLKQKGYEPELISLGIQETFA